MHMDSESNELSASCAARDEPDSATEFTASDVDVDHAGLMDILKFKTEQPKQPILNPFPSKKYGKLSRSFNSDCVCRDTTPDLSFCHSVRDARWSNTQESLGSDHYVLAIQVRTSPCKHRLHMARHTNWDVFRELRLHSAASNIEELSTWTDQLLADLEAVTASIPTT
ncbi:hypothetical protein MTO96_001308 [Rhipicephalus appendiculatus]